MSAKRKYRVGILGATGTIGQRFIQLLEHHSRFEVTALAASERSQGKTYAEACVWRLPGEMPSSVRSLTVEPLQPSLECDLVFSSLPSNIARDTEQDFARSGYPVISNSSAHRLADDVPLLIPEVNHKHLALLDIQRAQRDYPTAD
jgi:aspartate-semialdehyde dehydrogenase